MSSPRKELCALLLCFFFWLSYPSLSLGTSIDGAPDLRTLHTHKQILSNEMMSLYMSPPSAQSELILEELQQRQNAIQMQIDEAEANEKAISNIMRGIVKEERPKEVDSDSHIALNLTADFEHLQRKLDELKQHVELLDLRLATQSNGSHDHRQLWSSLYKRLGQLEEQENVRNAVASTTTPPSIGSYFWTPLLAMPEFTHPSIGHAGNQLQSSQSGSQSPSLIKRLLAILRPNGNATSMVSILRGGQATKAASTSDHLLSAGQLLPHLQEQRQFIDDAIKRLELIAADKPKRIAQN